ncbi:hypothetical protein VCHA35O141_110111 [Vibrio chagasii]|uniref:hypothetical protein n=1 Tax=Vibrio chagasii TaxID=170679 RepID=UPI00337F1C50|nr:hypothetical protein VCHA31O73_100038 [Vibrio chagasii]CAH6798806.1 hypothetical protein VCHA35O143_100111 [Vibrio chagasii]CAH6801360.1 hypothetical protein VCHA35O141_110111 [Vibrio chagasii]CAH6908946.1 hypothetical protein VCHA53O480_100038 [Vibrio chagasii]CAH6942282.1 hypothetical protein VCHA50O396_100038 [Vibrio chagasii]
MEFFKLLKEARLHWTNAQGHLGQLQHNIRKAREQFKNERDRLKPASALAQAAKINYFNAAELLLLVPTKYKETHKTVQALIDIFSKLEELANAAKVENSATQSHLLSLATFLTQNDRLSIPNLHKELISDFPIEKLQAQGFRYSEFANKGPDFQEFKVVEYIYETEGTKIEQGFKDLIPQANSAIESMNTLIMDINLSATSKIQPIKPVPTKQPKTSNKQEDKPHPMLTTPLPFEDCSNDKQGPTIDDLLFQPNQGYETPFQSGDLNSCIDYEFMIGEYSVVFIQHIGENQVDVTIEKFHKGVTKNGKYNLTEPQTIVFHKLIVEPGMANPDNFNPDDESIRRLLKRFSHCKIEGNFDHGISI